MDLPKRTGETVFFRVILMQVWAQYILFHSTDSIYLYVWLNVFCFTLLYYFYIKKTCTFYLLYDICKTEYSNIFNYLRKLNRVILPGRDR